MTTNPLGVPRYRLSAGPFKGAAEDAQEWCKAEDVERLLAAHLEIPSARMLEVNRQLEAQMAAQAETITRLAEEVAALKRELGR